MIRHDHPQSLRLVDRDAYILSQCEGAKVLHLGCTDSPVYESQFEAGRLLHPKLLARTDELYGVDLDAVSVEWFREQFGGEYLVADIESDEFVGSLHNRKFDVVLLPDVLEHMSCPYRALANIHRIADPETRFLVSVPNAYSAKGFLRSICGREVIHPDHVAFHSLYTLRNLLHRAGWHVTDHFSYVGGGTGIAASVMNAILRFFPSLAEGIGVMALRADGEE